MPHGTVIEATPSSSPTIGANATIMIVSLSATCVSVKYGIAAAQLAPDEHHRGARRGGEQDQARDVAVVLRGGQRRPRTRGA